MSRSELLIRCPSCSKLLKIAATTTPSKIQCPACNKTTDPSTWTVTVSAYFHSDIPIRIKEKFVESAWALFQSGFNSSGSSNSNMGPTYPFTDFNQRSHQPTSFTVKTPLHEQDIIQRLQPWHVFAVDTSAKTIRVVVTDDMSSP